MSDNIVEDTQDSTEVKKEVSQKLNKKKLSFQKLSMHDSFDIESSYFPSRPHGHDSSSKAVDWSIILHVAFQSIGIVYGDIGTSPLCVYSGIFPNGIQHEDDILASLSLIFYAITLIPVIKYVFIVLRANDNGEGN